MADWDDQDSAWRDGWNSHQNGVGVEDNPYDERRQEVSHEQWISGWCARFNAEKHEQDVKAGDEKYGAWSS